MLSNKAKRELKINQRRILIDSIEIAIPSPHQILTWGERELPNGKKVGEVKNSKTVNYKKFTPLRDGLFCERIFGPINSFICACGKRQPAFDVNFCDKCEVEYTDKQVRRSRLGYISLVSPVVHVWYLKGRPSYLSLFLGKRKKQMTALAYCNAYLVEQAFPSLNQSKQVSTFNPDSPRRDSSRPPTKWGVRTQLEVDSDFAQTKKDANENTNDPSYPINKEKTKNPKISHLKSRWNPSLTPTCGGTSEGLERDIRNKISANTVQSFSKIRQLSNYSAAYNKRILQLNLLKQNKKISSHSVFLAQKNSDNSATTLNIIKSQLPDNRELSSVDTPRERDRYLVSGIDESNAKKNSQRYNTGLNLPLISRTRVNKPNYLKTTFYSHQKTPLYLTPHEVGGVGLVHNRKEISDVNSYGEDKLPILTNDFDKNNINKVVFYYFFHILTDILNNPKNNFVLNSYAHSTPSLFGTNIKEKKLDFINFYLQRSTNVISFLDLYLHPQAKSFYKNKNFKNRVLTSLTPPSWGIERDNEVSLYKTKVQKVKNVEKFARQTLLIEHKEEERKILKGFSLPISRESHCIKKEETLSDRENSLSFTFPTSASFLLRRSSVSDTEQHQGGVRGVRTREHNLNSEKVDVLSTPNSPYTGIPMGTSTSRSTNKYNGKESPKVYSVSQENIAFATRSKNKRYSIAKKSILNYLTKIDRKIDPSLLPNKSDTSYFLHSKTPQKQIKQYNRAQSLPFLPSLICKYNVREELVTFFNSCPLQSDIPIPFYSHIHRWQALYDVHKFMAEQSLSSSTNLNLHTTPLHASRATGKNYSKAKTTGSLDSIILHSEKPVSHSYPPRSGGYRRVGRTTGFYDEKRLARITYLPKNKISKVDFNKQPKRPFNFVKVDKRSRNSINPGIEKWVHCIKNAIPTTYSIKTLENSFESRRYSSIPPTYPHKWGYKWGVRTGPIQGIGSEFDDLSSLIHHPNFDSPHFTSDIKSSNTKRGFILGKLVDSAWPLVLRLDNAEKQIKINPNFYSTLKNKSFNVFSAAKGQDVKLAVLRSRTARLNKISKDLVVHSKTTESHFRKHNKNKQKELPRQTIISLSQKAFATSKIFSWLNVSFILVNQVANRMPKLFPSQNIDTLLSQIFVNKKSLALVAKNLKLQIKGEISSEIVTNILISSRAYNYASICFRLFDFLSTFEKRLKHNVYSPLFSTIENKALINSVVPKSTTDSYNSVGIPSLSTDILSSPKNRENNVLLSLFLILPRIKAANIRRANAMDCFDAKKVNYNFDLYSQQKIANVSKEKPNLYTFVETRSNNSVFNYLNVSNLQIQCANTTSQLVLTRNLLFATLVARRDPPLYVTPHEVGDIALERKNEKGELFPFQEFHDNSQIKANINKSLDLKTTQFGNSDVNYGKNITPDSFLERQFNLPNFENSLEIKNWNLSNKNSNGYKSHQGINTEFLTNQNGSKHSVAVSGHSVTSHGVSPTLDQGTSKLAVNGGKQTEMLSHLELSTIREILAYTGGGALEAYLKRIDVISFFNFLSADIATTRIIYKNKLARIGYGNQVNRKQKRVLVRLARRLSINSRRLKIVQLFLRNKRRPEWMMISSLPVLPPDLRPILQMSESVVVASDINNLYQRVIYRNNRFHKLGFIDFHLVTAIQRLVQDAVDRLIENGKGSSKPFYTPAGRPLKSLSDTLKGKKGRFRYNLLGKRVDFSGRSVIVVSPQLRIQECGLPKEIALELYHYFLLRQILLKKQASSIVIAKKLIKQRKATIWNMLRDIIYHHPVLLNRAPTLHRLGIQAFQPKLIDGNAIWLHPLVCSAFNADFDGDQMGVHLPLSPQARGEAWDLLWSRNNLLSPATGQPVLVPSQDMVLGFYYMTQSFASPCLVLPQNTQKHSQSLNESNRILRSDLFCTTDVVLESNCSVRNNLFCATKVALESSTYNSDINTLTQNTTQFPFLDGRSTRSLNVRQLDPSKQFFYDRLQLLNAFQTGQISLHTPVWLALKYNDKFEHDKNSLLPLEIRMTSFANSTYIFSEYKRRKDETTSEFTTSIRTTAGKVLVNVFININ